MKKIFNYLFLSIVLVGIVFFSSCGKETKIPEHNVEVIFKLENGSYKNSLADVIHYYNFKEDQKHIIHSLNEFVRAEDSLIRNGYILEGWYTVKNDDGSYDNKWDFEANEVTNNSITLYANWIKETHYTYDLCFIDEEGTEIVLGSYEANVGSKFSDFKGLADRNYGYTRMSFLESGGFTDSNNEPWNPDFTHPGDENPNVKVYIKYLYGDYALVSTKEELLDAKNKSIYLLNSIDLEGANLSFADYKKEFIGNNYTISNFTLSYQADRNALKEDINESDKLSLYISLFGNTNEAIIKDINFDNVTIKIDTLLKTTYKIYLAAICSKAVKSNISNVHFTGTYEIVHIPSNMEKTNVLIETTNAYISIDDVSVISNNNINLANKNN